MGSAALTTAVVSVVICHAKFAWKRPQIAFISVLAVTAAKSTCTFFAYRALDTREADSDNIGGGRDVQIGLELFSYALQLVREKDRDREGKADKRATRRAHSHACTHRRHM